MRPPRGPPAHARCPRLAPTQQKDLPLSIIGIHATSPAFADTEPFPPSAVSSGAPPPAGASALDFFLNFESSGKWPDDLEAISHLKTAFYLRISRLLEEQTDLVNEVRRDAIYVQCEGFTFRGTIHHEPSLRLVEAAHGALAARELRWRSSAGAKHTAALSALSRTHPAFGPSVRLAKRWLGCQLFSGEMPSGLVELLAAAAFTSAFERPPASAACGFAHFLPNAV